MPINLANKIAAGEVVQRPASAVKELIENAIDAGADNITVIIKAAGSALMQVVDNGCGMSATDAKTCFDRHATSKIKSFQDLEQVHTLGFRGEALASIAAVSQVELKTRRHEDEVGTRIRLDGGAPVGEEACACPPGTSIAIRNLFYNVPARRSFLKTPATEFKHIVETFQFLALSHPDLSFSLHHDDHEVYRLPAGNTSSFENNLKRRIAALFGDNAGDSLIHVKEETSYLSVNGFVSSPDFYRRTRGEQFLFVNKRYIKSHYLEHAVRTAYETLIPEGSYPLFALFLTIDPRHIDVNVHPTKAEVKFEDERGIYSVVRTVVKKGVSTSMMSPQLDLSIAPSVPFRPATGSVIGNMPAMPSMPPRNRAPAGDLSAKLYDADPGQLSMRGTIIPSEANPDPAAGGHQDAGHQTLLWQIHGRFILTQIRSGLMIVDQNAAHERILYEMALKSLESGLGMSQQLLFPHTLDFNPADFELVKELLPDFKALGFDIELFGGRTVIIRGVPTDIKVGDERSVLDDILQQYKSNRDSLSLEARENLARSIARRGAITGNTQLDEKEMRSLIDQLFQCNEPQICPFGRPTLTNVTLAELEKRFGR